MSADTLPEICRRLATPVARLFAYNEIEKTTRVLEEETLNTLFLIRDMLNKNEIDPYTLTPAKKPTMEELERSLNLDRASPARLREQDDEIRALKDRIQVLENQRQKKSARAAPLGPEKRLQVARRLFAGESRQAVVIAEGITIDQTDVEWSEAPAHLITVPKEAPVKWEHLWVIFSHGRKHWKREACQFLNLGTHTGGWYDLSTVSNELIQQVLDAYWNTQQTIAKQIPKKHLHAFRRLNVYRSISASVIDQRP